MKKIAVLGMMALVLSLSVLALTGCSTDEEPSKMTFENADATKRFTIDENLKFKVLFLEEAILAKGQSVSGKINEASGKWTETTLSGVATDMTSTNEGVKGILQGADVGIELTYTKDDKGAITAVTILFTTGNYALAAQGFMGGSYDRKK